MALVASMVVEFQNIICYCLTTRHTGMSVSVLRFQNIICYCLTALTIITSHFYIISKHHMLLFNKEKSDSQITASLFQNIICYCLTLYDLSLV